MPLTSKFTFDPATKCILVNEPHIVYSGQELYDESMDWCDEVQNMGYDVPMSSTGKAPLGGGAYTDSVYSLVNNWKIKPWATSGHSFNAIDSDSTKITAESTDSGDTTQTITVYGYDDTGDPDVSDAITLNGTNPVDITKSGSPIVFTARGYNSGIYYVLLSAATAGDIIIKDSLGNTIVTLTAGQTVASDDYESFVSGTLITDDGSPRWVIPDQGYVGMEFQVTSQGIIIDEQTMLAQVSSIYQMEMGRWKIDTSTNKMTFYDTDGTTPLITFNLKDDAGLPSSTKVYERVPE